jgi:hypothetical protein
MPPEPDAPPAAPSAAAGARLARAAPWAAVALVAAVVAPVAAAGLAGWRAEWFPAGDWAVLELAARDVGSVHTPLVGPYSRYGWNHPGPLLFWVMALPYRLTGASATSLLAAAATVNATALVLMGWLAWRRGRLALVALVAVGMGGLTWATGGEVLRDPWNPWVTPFAFGALVLAAWSAAEGDRAALVLSGALGSFLVQSHVGYGPTVAVMVAWAVAGGWFAVRRGAWSARSYRRTVTAAGAVVACCWAPVVLDVARGGPNAALLVRHFGEGGDRAGWSEAVGLAARQLAVAGPWRGADEPVAAVGGTVVGGSIASLAVPVLVFALSAVAARRTGARPALRLQALVAVVVVVGVASVAQISGGVYGYLVRWWWPLAMLWWVAIAWSAWCAGWSWWSRRAHAADAPVASGRVAGPRRHRRVATAALAAVALALTGWSAVATVRALDHQPLPAQDWQPALAATVPPLVADLAGSGPVVVHAEGPLAGWAFDAVVLQLDRGGVPVQVHDGGINAHKFGPRRATGASTGPEVWVVTGTAAREAALARPGARLVAAWDRLDPGGRRAADERLATLVARLEDAGRADLVRVLERGDTLPFDLLPPEVPVELAEAVDEEQRATPPTAVVVVPDGGSRVS